MPNSTSTRTYQAQHEANIALSGEVPDYFAHYMMRDFRSLLNELALPSDDCYLDYGCGVGGSIEPFKRQLHQAQLFCADSFYGAFACCVFHHIPHEQHLQVLKDLKRVIRPGGVLMVYEHNPFNPLTVRAVRNCPFDENAHLIKATQLERTGRAAGFTLHRTNFRVFFPSMLAALRSVENYLRWLPLGTQYFAASRA